MKSDINIHMQIHPVFTNRQNKEWRIRISIYKYLIRKFSIILKIEINI